MQTLHTAAIHRLLGTPVTLDLNLGNVAADVAATRDQVLGLPKLLDDALQPTSQNLGQLRSDLTRNLDLAVAQLKQENAAALAATRAALQAQAEQGFKEVLAAIKVRTSPVPVPPPDPQAGPLVVTTKATPLVRLLTQVQTLALDASPGEPYAGKEPKYKGWIKENVTLDHLRDAARQDAALLTQAPKALQERFVKAFDDFSTTEPAARNQRFAEVHVLIYDVAAFLAHA